MENFTNISNDISFIKGTNLTLLWKVILQKRWADLLQFCNANIGSINLKNLRHICWNNNLFFFRFKRNTLWFIVTKTAWEYEPVEFEFYKQFKHDTGTNFKTYCSKDLFSEVMTKPRNKVISFQESYRANNATVINFP